MSNDPADVQAALEGIDYPATKAGLMSQARTNDATDDVIASLAQLPDDASYASADAVSAAVSDVER